VKFDGLYKRERAAEKQRADQTRTGGRPGGSGYASSGLRRLTTTKRSAQ